MAGAAIALGSTIIPAILPWIAKLMDKIHGNGTGPTKLADGTSLAEKITTAIQAMLTGTGISIPTTAAELGPLLQKAVDDLNKAGVLKGHDTVVEAPPGTVSATMDPRAFFLDAATMLSSTAIQFMNFAKTAPK